MKPAEPTWATHRPGVLLISHDAVELADLDEGSAREVEVSSLFFAGHPELQLIEGAELPERVSANPAALLRPEDATVGTGLAGEEALYVLSGAVALRIDDGRVLAWDRSAERHVELSALHLGLIDALRKSRTTSELQALFPDDSLDSALLGLQALYLIQKQDSSADVVDAPEPEVEVEAAKGGGFPTDTLVVAPSEVGVGLSERRHAREATGTAGAPSDAPVGPAAELGVISRLLRRLPRRSSDDPQVGKVADGSASDESRVDESLNDRRHEEPSEDSRGAEATQSRVPVIPLYYYGKVIQPDGLIEPSLAVGMLMAYARAFDGGRLNDKYEFRRMQADPEIAIAKWLESPVPAVFVFPDYIWSIERNLALTDRIKAISPESLCIHGGPSSPKYHGDSMQFFEDNPSVDAAARGEGEETFAAVLDALDGELSPEAIDRLADVPGITYRRRTGSNEVVRNQDRPRPVALNEFPSPYLTGEFDDLLSLPWRWATLETNRGCPYGCTFCDWGSATSARVRKFDLEQIKQEIEWILENVDTAMMLVADANFGIFAQDVEIVEHVVELKKKHPHFTNLAFTGLAKNTVKYTKQIYRLLYEANLTIISSPLSIQSADPEVLAAVDRENIKLERYDELAETFREMSIPMMTDLIVGLPGSSIRSFKHDLQFCFDREITPRIFPLLMLPNSPMNEPSYKERYQIVWNDQGQIVSTSTFDEADLRRMEWIRLIYRGGDHFGVLRHLFQYVQWDHGILASEFADAIDLAIRARGNRYPLLAFFGRLFDLYTLPPVAWQPFYDEVIELLADRFGVEMDSALRSVITLQLAMAPARGRTFPATVELEHDFVAYRADRLATGANRKLATYGPGQIRVDDPGGVSRDRLLKNEMLGNRQLEFENVFWNSLDWELSSPLSRPMFSNDYLFQDRSETKLSQVGAETSESEPTEVPGGSPS